MRLVWQHIACDSYFAKIGGCILNNFIVHYTQYPFTL